MVIQPNSKLNFTPMIYWMGEGTTEIVDFYASYDFAQIKVKTKMTKVFDKQYLSPSNSDEGSTSIGDP